MESDLATDKDRTVGVFKWDGHTHTQFCKHGSPENGELYVRQAIAQNFSRYSMTEHPPLPVGWVNDSKVMDELAMPIEELDAYLDFAWQCKRKYEGQIDLLPGLELDYLPGAEAHTLNLLERVGSRLEDLVVSVHFLPGRGGMRCVDLSAPDFAEGLVAYYGSMEAVAEVYFAHVEQAIAFAAELPGRKRMGHIGLIEKFRKVLPPLEAAWMEKRMSALLPFLQKVGVGVDVNTAGLRKDTCGKVYVPEWFVRDCQTRGVECVFGSDAHSPQDVGAGWEWFEALME